MLSLVWGDGSIGSGTVLLSEVEPVLGGRQTAIVSTRPITGSTSLSSTVPKPPLLSQQTRLSTAWRQILSCPG